jgi:serine/threonine protein kinase
MAPEIIDQNMKGYGMTVDWWSLGILLYQMLTGEVTCSFIIKLVFKQSLVPIWC